MYHHMIYDHFETPLICDRQVYGNQVMLNSTNRDAICCTIDVDFAHCVADSRPHIQSAPIMCCVEFLPFQQEK